MTNSLFDNWTTQLRKGMLELAILNALSQSQLYGYQITRKLSEIQGLVVTEGTIYPILSRLKRDRLVTTTLEESSEGPARKYYYLTKLGRSLLTEMNTYFATINAGLTNLAGASV